MPRATATPRETGALVRLFHVSKSYLAGSFALRDINLELAPGEFAFLTGPSGAGKTTLLRLIFGAERPSAGQLLVLGRNVGRLGARGMAPLRRRVGVVFQDFKLLPRHTVEENVGIALDVMGVPQREKRERVYAMLRRVGLRERRAHHPLSLSGGEQQRLAIARALVGEPRLLLADEPTGNLDAKLTYEIMDLIASVASGGTAVFVATHDQTLVERYGRRVVRLEAGALVEDRVLTADARRAASEVLGAHGVASEETRARGAHEHARGTGARDAD